MAARKPAPQPWEPPAYDDADIHAMKALAAGKASEGQQKRALEWIIQRAAATYDLPFRPGGLEGARATDFSTGRMFVGQQIVKLVNYRLKPKPSE